MYTFIEKWIIIVYYEHIIIYASSWTDGPEVISDIYLYSRWLVSAWLINLQTSLPEGCRTSYNVQDARIGMYVILYIYVKGVRIADASRYGNQR